MNAFSGIQPLLRLNDQLSSLVLKSSLHDHFSLKWSKEMACLKFTFNFTISQTPLKCQDAAFLESEFLIADLGWSHAWLGFCTERVKKWGSSIEHTWYRHADGLQCSPNCCFASLRTVSPLMNSTSSYSHLQFGGWGGRGAGLVGTAGENSLGGCPELGMDGRLWERIWQALSIPYPKCHFALPLQYAGKLFLSQGEIALFGKGEVHLVYCLPGNQAITSLRWWFILYLGCLNNLSITSLQGYVSASPVSWQAAWSSPAFFHLIFICSSTACIRRLGVLILIAGDKTADSEIISKQLGQGCTNPSALRDPEGLFLFPAK